MKKYLFLAMALMMGTMFLASCNDDDDDNDGDKKEDVYKDRKYGREAIEACNDLVNDLTTANSAISQAKLTTEQEAELKQVVAGVVDNVIVPTYKNLADDTESLLGTLKGLDVNTLTQTAINNACADFKKARNHWELSEAFLGGAASDFDVDPTIDSWPLNRTLLISYLAGGNTDFSEEMLEDASILGFHALEFILFRNGNPRNVNEFKGYDTYKGFERITGASELAYAQRICELLYQRTCQLQVAWEGATATNASRVAVVDAAGLERLTTKGYSFGDNMKNAGDTKISTFPNLKDAIAQILSADEGSCVGIADEVGNAKIANPFSSGDVSYVESPFSYNSITDFQDNIRSIRNVWLGSLSGSAASHSFQRFFAANATNAGKAVSDSYTDAIAKIGAMPAPFVKYVSTIWGIAYEDTDVE